MRATIRDSLTLRNVKPLEVAAYLRAHGWREVSRIENGAFWVKSGDSATHEILLPLEADLVDYNLRIAEILGALEEAEGRSQLLILEDLANSSADVIRPRLIGSAEDGTISLEDGVTAYVQARALMLAAACSTVEPRAVFAKRKPERAMSYLNHAKFGIPKRGSYVLTIISPVTPRLKGAELFDEFPDEPFERRTVQLLADALLSANGACSEIATSGSFEPMKAAVRRGVSANLCEALVAMHECSGGRGLEFSFSWAPSRGVPGSAPLFVRIPPDSFPFLKETVRILKETSNEKGVELLGTVQKLAHQSGTRGRATIQGSVEGIPRAVSVDLEGDDHRLAVRSYEERIPIVCVGDLQKEGRSWILKNPQDIRLLEGPILSD